MQTLVKFSLKLLFMLAVDGISIYDLFY